MFWDAWKGNVILMLAMYSEGPWKKSDPYKTSEVNKPVHCQDDSWGVINTYLISSENMNSQDRYKRTEIAGMGLTWYNLKSWTKSFIVKCILTAFYQHILLFIELPLMIGFFSPYSSFTSFQIGQLRPTQALGITINIIFVSDEKLQ